MACVQTQGVSKDCLDSIGGIKKIYIGSLKELNTYTATAGAVTAMSMLTGKKLWTYDVGKANANFDEDLKKSVEAGTKYYEGTGGFTLKKMSVAQQNELDILAQLELIFAFEDNNGNHWITGLENGVELLERKSSSGKAFADMNGYTLSFNSMEPKPIYSISSAIIDTLIVAAV